MKRGWSTFISAIIEAMGVLGYLFLVGLAVAVIGLIYALFTGDWTVFYCGLIIMLVAVMLHYTIVGTSALSWKEFLGAAAAVGITSPDIAEGVADAVGSGVGEALDDPVDSILDKLMPVILFLGIGYLFLNSKEEQAY